MRMEVNKMARMNMKNGKKVENPEALRCCLHNSIALYFDQRCL